jgi:HEPN domain-containing protein
MHKDEVDVMQTRAKNFFGAAKQRFQEKDWDLTIFFSEQSVQLLLKAKILEIGGESPKTHSLRKLFCMLYHLTKDENFKYDRKDLIYLENAYLNTRYFDFRYDEEDAKLALKIVKEVKNIVRKFENDDLSKRNARES